MEPNVGGFDRTVRITLGLGALAVAVAAVTTDGVTGDTQTLVAGVSLILAAILLVTAMTRRCLGNRLLGINTCEKGQ
ncbi:YgaP family membrane protein [Natronosalvus vescus]|uniref:YgaP family membrane protein n=1 Tax=Natronosalvus vescus TaxID=2953881 RepID=UPI0020908F2D|nr:DUF2892 domain-containing protein [Natronosalvus vescus]